MLEISSDYEMFPLDTFLNTFGLDKELLLTKHRPNFLISQIKSIPRDIVEQLERVGIYDTGDFLKASQNVISHLNISAGKYAELLEHIVVSQKSKFKLPKIILQLPQNFALVSGKLDNGQILFGIYWRGLKLRFTDQSNDWSTVKFKVDTILEKMHHPDLIGRISLSTVPSWLDEVIPLSTYISNLDYDQDIVDIAISWGLDPHFREIFDTCDQDLLAQVYLLELQSRLSNEL